MRIEKVSYHKTFNLGNYSNEKIGVDIVLAPGDDPLDAFAKAKTEVEKSHNFFREAPTYERSKNIVSSPLDHTGGEVKQADEFIAAFEANYPDFINKFQSTSRQLTQGIINDYEGDRDELGF